MSDRDTQITAFIAHAGWDDAQIAPLAGDASNRRYLRLTRNTGDTAVLMDAPPSRGEDVGPFMAIATYLTGIGLSAPRILAADDSAGFLLLEDLGDALFARVIPNAPQLENSLYSTATDLLVHLHAQTPPPGLARYDAATATPLAALIFDWYLPGLDITFRPATRTAFETCLSDLLTTHCPNCDVLIQRDYHAENLLWLPDRDSISRVGLLDFQDAMLGHRAYDLVSLLQDARRDVPQTIETQMRARYAQATGQDPDDFARAYAVQGAQRNLRILGVFARLCLRDGKAHYVDLIPRVSSLLNRDLADPALTPLADILSDLLPDPTQDLLQKLKSKCAIPLMR